MTEEWENTSRLIKANAEALESRALDRLNTLMTERRKARKVYQEDHSKISSQFTQVSYDVHKNIIKINLVYNLKEFQIKIFLFILLKKTRKL